MRIVLLILVTLSWPLGQTALSKESENRKLFATEWIQPSEAGAGLIEALFKGQIAALPETSQIALDKPLKQGDWRSMDVARQNAAAEFGAQAVLDWAATRHLAGYLGASSRYGLDLLSIGQALDRPDLSEASVGVFLYIYAVTLVDGHKCTDPTSAEVFMNQTLDAYAEVRTFAATLPKTALEKANAYAIALENHIAPARAADPSICSVGEKRLEFMVAQNDYRNALMSALKRRQSERAVGGQDLTALPTEEPPSWIKPEATWQADAAAAREQLPGWLSDLTARMAAR